MFRFRDLLKQNKDLRYKIKCLEYELEEKTKEVHHLAEQSKELKTQMFTYQRIIRDEKDQKITALSNLEALTQQYEIELSKRERIEKRVRKFAKWLHKDQKLYIENLVAKLGIEDNDNRNSRHKRVSS